MPRSLGGTNTPLSTSHTVSPAMTILPASGRSRPARQRKVVVLPQPDGPSRVMSLPVSTPRLMSSTALTVTLPGALKVLRRWSIENMDGLSGRCPGGGCGAALDAQLEPSQCGHDEDERNDLDDAERGDGTVAAALLPHRETDGAEHMGARPDQEHRGAELAHRQHEDVDPRRQQHRQQQRQQDAQEHLPYARAGDFGRFLELLV